MKITELTDKKIWLTSDWHLGHDNVIKYCNRPFANTSEMNTALRKNFNKLVAPHDIVYVLGDISFLNTVSTTEWIKSLHGFKFLIKGNHDPKTNTAYRKMGFTEVYDKPIILFDRYILSHEPLFDDEYVDTRFINIYGHLHNNAVNEFANKYCVSVEKTDYKPISLEQISEEVVKFL